MGYTCMQKHLRNGQVGNIKLVGIDNTGFPSKLVFIDVHVKFTVISCIISIAIKKSHK